MKRYSFKAPTPFEFELKRLSEITQIKRRITGVPHRTDFYQILWIESGESIQTVDFCPIKVVGGELLFIAQNQVISFDTSSLYSGQIILFTDMFFNRCDGYTRLMKQLNLFNPFTGNTPIVISERLTSLWNMMKDEFQAKHDNFQANILHSLLTAFLIQASRQTAENISRTKNNDYQIALQFIELVEQHYQSLRKVNDYVDLMSVSAKSLSKSLQTAIGKTPKQFIDDRILLESKRMLVYSNESIKEISFTLGFEEPNNFSKFFKEQTRLTPSEFKKQHLS
jgi:AraC-like DNA-binding protein